MKILAIEKEIPGVAASRFTVSLLESEARRVWHLQQENIIREIYFRQEQKSAVLILECDNKESAISILKTLPLVEKKMIDFDVIPLVAYPGLARLFDKAKPVIMSL